MAETCIVCLGDLATGPLLSSNFSESVTNGLKVELKPEEHDLSPSRPDILANADAIAELLPCRHTLHNECLKPWVERANSCPICRQSFNIVELKSTLHGVCESSYAVEDRQQVAELDPSMIVEDDPYDEEEQIHPCFVCEEYGDDEVLLLCDGCNSSCHTFCCDLDSVPAGTWFCQFCSEEGLQAPMRTSRQRTRGRQQRLGSRRDLSPSAWTRVWQSVWSRLHLDLDFPFDDDMPPPRTNSTHRRDFEQWQERFRVAERQGAAARFRDTAAALLDIHAAKNGNTTSQPESQEELRAWNAFEKAKELQSESSSSGRNKRKSPTASPIEPSPVPERKLKRPRTRRAQEIPDVLSDPAAETSIVTPVQESSLPTSTIRARLRSEVLNPGPSFLQSLLNEVESKSELDWSSHPGLSPLNIVTTNAPEYPSPNSPSPASSPASSNHPSPRNRSATPPPFLISRPSSPPLTSRIEPIFAQPPDYSPFSPAEHPPDRDAETVSSKSARGSRPALRMSMGSSSQRFTDTSPLRTSMSLAAKAEIQTMVKAALRPLYIEKKIDKDQYTGINRDISRMLYDRVGEAGGLTDGGEREKWKRVAMDAVDTAVKALKSGEVVA